MDHVGATGLGGLWGWAPQIWAVCGRGTTDLGGLAWHIRVTNLRCVAYSRNKLALRTRLRNLNL